MQNGGYLNNLFYDKSHTIIFPAGTQRQNNIQTTLLWRYSDIACLLCFKYRTTKIADLKNAFYPAEMNFNGAHNVLLQCGNTLLDCAIRSHSFHCFVISLVIFCKRLKIYTVLWIPFVKAVIMGRPKTTWVQHKEYASKRAPSYSYVSQLLFKSLDR